VLLLLFLSYSCTVNPKPVINKSNHDVLNSVPSGELVSNFACYFLS